ncbi:MAG: ABC transporter permease [Eubacteriales bacterium]|nr:ABC transporter permease [Eubacteriales bacterium]
MKQRCDWKKIWIPKLDVLTILGMSVLLMIIFAASNPRFLTIGNFFNLIQQNAALAVVAVGMTFVVISGNMDLSSGSLIVLSACTAGLVFQKTGNMFLGILGSLCLSAVIGAFNGSLIAYGKINAVIVTLSCMMWARGLALGITGASSIAISSGILDFLYRPFLLGFVNVSLLIVILIMLTGAFLLGRTKFGRYTRAIGENEAAAALAGINTKRIKWKIFMLAAVLAGIASVLDLARLGSAVTTIGTNMELNAIVAVVIGGNKLSGGEGSFAKTISGLLFMFILYNGLSTLGMTDDILYLLKGGIILFVLAVQVLTGRLKMKWMKQMNSSERKEE